MRLLAIHVRHFRCIEDETLKFDDLTAIVGPNGTGKSAFLRTLNYFYEGPAGIGREDFYNRDTDTPVEITATYGSLTGEERDTFGAYLDGDLLKVLLRIRWVKPEGDGEGSAQGAYHGWTARHGPFQKVRAGGSAADKVKMLKELVASDAGLYDFAPDSAWGRAEPQMAAWERNHPQDCSREEDNGGYFKGPNTGTGPLARHCQLIFVPAVRDASDEGAESRSNTIGRLVSLVVGDISTSDAIQQLSQDFKATYAEAVGREALERLPALQQRLTEALRGYVAHASVRLEWQGADVRLDMPTTAVRLDDGFLGPIEGKGHGLQRLFIVSLLQVAAALRSQHSEDATAETRVEPGAREGARLEPQAGPDYVLAIEEPELYQHPMQARRFASVLSALASADSGQGKSQVVYSTHSPLFVGVDRFDSIRLARKVEATSGLPLVTRMHSTTLAKVMKKVNQAFGRERRSVDRFRSTLATILSPSVSEGFFARTLVLVEGAEDQAVVDAALRAGKVDLEADGIAVIPVEGKANMDRPYAIFTALGIQCYVVFDADAGKTEDKRRPEINLALQALCGESHPKDFPETGARPCYTVFKRDLTKDVPDEFGAADFYLVRDEVARRMGWEDEPSHAQKNPAVLKEVMTALHAAGRRSQTLDAMVEAVRAVAAATGG